jgi:hypothetical protein
MDGEILKKHGPKLVYFFTILSFILSVGAIPIITRFLIPILKYLWITTLILTSVSFYFLSKKYITFEIKKYRKGFDVGIAVIGLFFIIGLLHVSGIVPLSVAVEPLHNIALGGSFTCPSNAVYYGNSGCGIWFNYYGGEFHNSNPYPFPQGKTFTCTQLYNMQNQPLVSSCTAQFALPSTPNSVATTFTENGLPSDYEWYVTYDGMQQSAISGSSITFTTAPGTYGFSVQNVNGYTASPSSGYLNAGTPQTITFSVPITPTPSSSPSTVGTISATFKLAILNPVLALESFLFISR